MFEVNNYFEKYKELFEYFDTHEEMHYFIKNISIMLKNNNIESNHNYYYLEIASKIFKKDE